MQGKERHVSKYTEGLHGTYGNVSFGPGHPSECRKEHENLMIAFKTHREKSAMVQNTRKGCTERMRTYRLAETIHQNAGQNA